MTLPLERCHRCPKLCNVGRKLFERLHGRPPGKGETIRHGLRNIGHGSTHVRKPRGLGITPCHEAMRDR